MTDEIIEYAMLVFPYLEVGHIITSALRMAFTAFTVKSSGSPGPHPTQTSSAINDDSSCA